MKTRNRPGSSTLFLLELVFAILFFALAAAVCVQFFVRSHVLSTEAKALNMAVNTVSSTAEMVAASGDLDELGDILARELPALDCKAEPAALDCKAALTVEGEFDEAGEYSLLVSARTEENMLCADISVTDGEGGVVYTLEVLRHIQREAGR